MIIRSPLGALGALMVLLEGISAGALATLKSQPDLQRYLVFMMIATISLITFLVIFIVVRFALTRPGLLFDPRDISPSVHPGLYVQTEPTTPENVSLTLVEERQENKGG